MEKSELVHDRTAGRPIALSSMPSLTKDLKPARAAMVAVAVAALLAQPPAYALSLGPVDLQSYLGEPLRAEIPLGVAPGERLLPACIRLATDATAGTYAGIPYEARLRIAGSGGSQRLLIEGRVPLREPIVDLTVSVNCPGTPVLERAYLLMLTPAVVAALRTPVSPTTATDPAETRSTPRAATAQPGRTSTPAERPSGATQRAGQTTALPLRAGAAYRVAPGDSLSTIAQRVSDRPGTLWAQAEAIFVANPTAFIAGDRNRIRAGAVIDIPADTASAVPAFVPPAATPAPAVSSIAPAMVAAQPVGPPRPARVESALQPDNAGGANREPARATSVESAEAVATAATTTPATRATPAGIQRDDGLLRWITGLLVGLGFIVLGGLLAWTALRRRALPDAPVDYEETGRATRLAPPPSFDPTLMQTGTLDRRAHGMQVEEATDEVEVLKTGPVPDVALDDLFPGVAQAPDLPSPTDVPQSTDDPQIDVEGTGSFTAPALDLGRKRSGETTVEHRFDGFSDTQALELQMAEAMAMLEQDYTSRFAHAVSLDDTGTLEATDTLHGVPAEVMRSLKDLEAQAEGADTQIDAATAILPAPEIGADNAPRFASADDDAAEADDDEARTARLEQPGKASTG